MDDLVDGPAEVELLLAAHVNVAVASFLLDIPVGALVVDAGPGPRRAARGRRSRPGGTGYPCRRWPTCRLWLRSLSADVGGLLPRVCPVLADAPAHCKGAAVLEPPLLEFDVDCARGVYDLLVVALRAGGRGQAAALRHGRHSDAARILGAGGTVNGRPGREPREVLHRGLDEVIPRPEMFSVMAGSVSIVLPALGNPDAVVDRPPGDRRVCVAGVILAAAAQDLADEAVNRRGALGEIQELAR